MVADRNADARGETARGEHTIRQILDRKIRCRIDWNERAKRGIVGVGHLRIVSFLPSPLAGEGGENKRSALERGEGLQLRRETPHPPSLREGTLSHKGRGEKSRLVGIEALFQPLPAIRIVVLPRWRFGRMRPDPV